MPSTSTPYLLRWTHTLLMHAGMGQRIDPWTTLIYDATGVPVHAQASHVLSAGLASAAWPSTTSPGFAY